MVSVLIAENERDKMNRCFLRLIALLYSVLFAIPICLSNEWPIYCHGEVEYDPRLSLTLVDPLAYPRIPWREFVVPEGGLYRVYHSCTDIDPCDQEVLDWILSVHCVGVDYGEEFVQLSKQDILTRTARVQAICIAAEQSARCMRADLPFEFQPAFFQRLAKLPELYHLELYQFAMNSEVFREISKLAQLQYIGLPHDTSDQHLELIAELDHLEFVNLSACRIGGKSLGILGRLPRLRILDLRRNTLDSGVLVAINSCSALETLLLSDTNIKDEDIEPLTTLENLKYVTLHNTSVTDKGLDYLAQKNGLKYVSLNNTSTTKEGRDRLTRRHPDLTLDVTFRRPLKEFIRERHDVHAWLGDKYSQYWKATHPDDDFVESLKWCLVLADRKSEKPVNPITDEALNGYIERYKARLNGAQIAEAEARARAYLYLLTRSKFNIQLERKEGLPLYQYAFGLLEQHTKNGDSP